MKKVISLLVISLGAATVSAAVHPGYSIQCWKFDTDQVIPDTETIFNQFGSPGADITDLSGQGVTWNQEGFWEGPSFQMVFEIPNRPVVDLYKEIKITMVFRGEISDSWIVDHNGDPFTLINRTFDYQSIPGWNIVRDEWRIEPNPFSEVITIVLTGLDGQNAAIDRICIETLCIPEPATLAILGFGTVVLIRSRKSFAR